MMHSACSPAATPCDTRVSAQPNFAQKSFGLKGRADRAQDFEGNDEPSLDELMDDDVVRRVMARDGVEAHQVWTLIDTMRNRLR